MFEGSKNTDEGLVGRGGGVEARSVMEVGLGKRKEAGHAVRTSGKGEEGEGVRG